MANSSGFIAELAKDLRSQGLEHAFGVTGSGLSLELITALERQGITYHPVAHEAAGVMMAGACSQDGATRALSITIKGPGFANSIPGLLSNFYENRPALTVSEAYGSSVPKFRMHKRLDHRALATPLVKGFVSGTISSSSLTALLKLAAEEAPGPVHLDLHLDAAHESQLKAEAFEPSRSNEIEQLLRLVQDSKRPAVVLGSAARRRLNRISWRGLKIPVVTTAAAKGCFDETHPFSGGVITGEIKDLSPESSILKYADLVVAFGLRNTEMVQVKPLDISLVNVDCLGGKLHDGFEAKINLITSDLEMLASGLLKILEAKSWGKDILDSAKDKLEEALFKDPWLPPMVFRKTQSLLPDAILVLDTGFFCTVGETVWRAKTPRHFAGSSNGRFMGTGIPTAIGTSLAMPQSPIIAVFGDGGVRPYFPEIRLAVAEKLPILFILMSDEGYGSIASVGRAKGLLRKAFEIPESSWWRAAQAMNCRAGLANSPGELEDAVKSWQKNSGPLFLETHFDPQRYSSVAEKLR